MPRLFERFHRVENARGRTHEGSGIGLALVQELVKLHGGSIAAESALGRGHDVHASRVPLGSAHLPPDQIGESRARPPRRSTGARALTSRRRCAGCPTTSADDVGSRAAGSFEALPVPALPARARRRGRPRPACSSPTTTPTCGSTSSACCAERYRVEAVADGEAALAAAREQPPDLVLTDVMMPRLDGFGLLRELRADPRTRDVPGHHALGPRRRGERASRGWRPAPTTT